MGTRAIQGRIIGTLRGFAGAVPGRALAWAALAGCVVAVSDAIILSLVGNSHWLGYFLALKGVLVAALLGLLFVFALRRATSMRRELYLARHDPSTKLLGRAEWIRHLDDALRPGGYKEAVVLTVSVDHYDYLVHRFGSESLHQWLGVFGRYLRMLAGGDDGVGCVGPAEFVMCLVGSQARQQAMDIAARIQESSRRTLVLQDEPVTVDLNVGLCAYPNDGAQAEDLLAHAHIAMRRAAAEGASRCCWYRPEIAEQVVSRVKLERELRRALQRQELQLYFQPRIALSGEGISGCEALLRWRHPRLGLVLPAAFISVAEESGLIVDIGKWVLTQSLAFLREWTGMGLPVISVSVNVSHAQLDKSDFLKDLNEALGEHRHYAPFLELELTESLAMSDPQRTMQVLRAVKQAGMRVALDDFGTGYSSLSYLQRFPIDCLKIDRSFITDLADNRNSQELIKTVIALGQSLGARVLAEGVESRAQVRILADYGCDEAQGYFYGRPMPAAELLARGQEAQHGGAASDAVPAFLQAANASREAVGAGG